MAISFSGRARLSSSSVSMLLRMHLRRSPGGLEFVRFANDPTAVAPLLDELGRRGEVAQQFSDRRTLLPDRAASVQSPPKPTWAKAKTDWPVLPGQSASTNPTHCPPDPAFCKVVLSSLGVGRLRHCCNLQERNLWCSGNVQCLLDGSVDSRNVLFQGFPVEQRGGEVSAA